MPIALWRLFLDRPPRVAALWMEFMGADRPQVADQRPICLSKPAIQRDEPGTVGIRQISTRYSYSVLASVILSPAGR
jgi:hypothetical protein